MKANVLLQSATKVVAESVFSPATFDFWASHINPAWSWQTPRARVIAREVTAKDSVTLILKPNRHVQPFIAGQHVSITVEIAGIRLTRSYSPSWISGQEQLFSITVKRMHGGKVSQWLCDDSIVGQVVEIGTAFGEMTLAQPHPLRVFLAAGSGITPLMSMIRAATSVNSPDAIHLIYWVRRREELCFLAELDSLKAAHPNLHVQFVLTQQDDLQSTERSGRINAAQIIDIVHDLGNSLVYACGPAGFVEQARQLTQAASGFYGEAFSLPRILDTEASGDAHVNLELTLSKRSLRVPVGMPLLAALEAQGIRPASGCRMGLCNTCACIKQSGTTEHVLSRDRNDEAGTTVRICVSRACSDLSLAL